MPSKSFLDSLNRQAEMTQRDLPFRFVSVTIGFAAGLAFQDVQPLLAAYLTYVLTEVVGAHSLRRLGENCTRFWYVVHGLACMVGGFAMTALPVMIWQHPSTAAKIAALCICLGTILHVVIVRSYHVPFTLAIAMPVVWGTSQVAVSELQHETHFNLHLASTGMALLLCFYVARAIHDMHEMRQILIRDRDRADAASKSKSRFVASMSHEIRTPLNGILGIAQLSLEEAKTAVSKDRAEVLYSSALTLKALVDDVLDHAKIEAGKMDIRPTPTDLGQLLTTVARLFADVAQTKGIQQQVETDGALPPLAMLDGLRVRQIVSNLMSNAIKFTDVGEVVLRGFQTHGPKGPLLCIEVRDTGPGMSPQDQDKLFKSFSQVDSDGARAATGTGLGLVISRNLARMMGGDLTVDSRCGQGTRFLFSMPLILPDLVTIEAAQATIRSGFSAADINAVAALSLTAQRVLLVDDNRANRMIARAFMQKAQIQVTEADSGGTALALLQQAEFDLVLLDIHMPGMDGIETLKRLRALPSPVDGVPVIALTADAAPEDREHYLGAGMDGYLSKPLGKADLFHEMERVLRNRAALYMAAE